MLLDHRPRRVSEVISARQPQHERTNEIAPEENDPAPDSRTEDAPAVFDALAEDTPAVPEDSRGIDETPVDTTASGEVVAELSPGITAVEPAVLAGDPAARATAAPEPCVEVNADGAAEPAWGAPRLLRTDGVLGASIITAEGERWGIVEDLLLEPLTGAVAGVRALQISERDEVEPRIVAYQPDGWRVVETQVDWVLDGADATADETDFSELFEAEQVATVEGEVIAIEVTESEPVHAVTLKLRDDNNVLHRALVEGAPLVLHHMPSIAAGERLLIRAQLTRDEVGKLWVATALSTKTGSLEIRDASGAVRWTELANGFLAVRELRGAALETAEGSTVVMTDFLLDRQRGVVSAVCVDVDGIEHVVPWGQIATDARGRWCTPLSVLELSELNAPNEADSSVLSPGN